MTQDEIIRMAREAGMRRQQHNLTSNPVQHRYSYECYEEQLERFFQAAFAAGAAAEREACEALHEHEDVQAPVGNSSWGEAYQEGWAEGTAAYRDAIRARSQQ